MEAIKKLPPVVWIVSAFAILIVIGIVTS